MAKFNVGDRVKSKLDICKEWGVGIVISVFVNNCTMNNLYNVHFNKFGIRNIQERELELVEHEKCEFHEPSYTQEYWYNIDGDFSYLGYLQSWDYDAIKGIYKMVFINPKKPNGVNHTTVGFHKENYKKHLFTTVEKGLYDTLRIEHTKKLESVSIDKIKKAFERPMNTDELAEQISKSFKETMEKHGFNTILLPKSLYEVLSHHLLKPQPPKNRIPDRVVFNQDKGKVTVLISKHMDGVEPYWSYTSKVHADGGDKFDAEFGFALSYYKYLIRHLGTKEHQEMIERLFKLPRTQRFVYLLGVIEQEVLKVNSIKSYSDWQDIYLAITDTNGTNVFNHTWDYAEWREMLRVHELETKREHQKEISKKIKAHQLEIDKLKGENDKK